MLVIEGFCVADSNERNDRGAFHWSKDL